MKFSRKFKTIRSELAQTGCIRTEHQRVELISTNPQVKELWAELKEKLSQSKELHRITLLESDGLAWSLILSSGYNITQAAVKKQTGGLKLCCAVIREISLPVLAAREQLLRRQYAPKLRSRLWFDINCWLTRNPSGLPSEGPPFQYWDKIPDQPRSIHNFYGEEKANRIQQLYDTDLKNLGDLGNYLTCSPACSNNPDSSVKDRVISVEMKNWIDLFLAVREFNPFNYTTDV
jgi:hypothetical protein